MKSQLSPLIMAHRRVLSFFAVLGAHDNKVLHVCYSSRRSER